MLSRWWRAILLRGGFEDCRGVRRGRESCLVVLSLGRWCLGRTSCLSFLAIETLYCIFFTPLCFSTSPVFFTIVSYPSSALFLWTGLVSQHGDE